jgi:hypothetical protein
MIATAVTKREVIRASREVKWPLVEICYSILPGCIGDDASTPVIAGRNYCRFEARRKGVPVLRRIEAHRRRKSARGPSSLKDPLKHPKQIAVLTEMTSTRRLDRLARSPVLGPGPVVREEIHDEQVRIEVGSRSRDRAAAGVRAARASERGLPLRRSADRR